MKTTNKMMAFFLLAFILGSCEGVHDYFNGEEQDIGIILPLGSGAIQIVLAAGDARTIMPSGALSSFNHFSYFFARNGGAQTEITPQNNGFFVLEQGSYQVTVNAYMTGGEGSLAAQGTSDVFSITDGKISPAVEITMHPYVSGDGAGTLEFFLQYPEGVVVETYRLISTTGSVIYNLTGTSTGSNPVVLSGTLAVPVGYYELEVRLKNAANEYTGKVESVHIYQNMVAKVNPEDYAFTASEFTPNRTPVVSDYAISGVATYNYDGEARPVYVVASPDASTGAVTVYYNNSPAEPVNAGTYTVTFNVAAASGWNEAVGLPAGTLTIKKAAGATVSGPALNAVTNSSITIKAVNPPGNGQTVEYARNTSGSAPGTGWQDGTSFTGLGPATTYYIFARSKQNTNYDAGPASTGLLVTTPGTAGITVGFWINEDDQILDTHPSNNSITISRSSNQSFSASVAGTYSNIKWFIQGDPAGTARSITIKAADYLNGTYRLNVIVERDGIPFSSEIRFTVTN